MKAVVSFIGALGLLFTLAGGTGASTAQERKTYRPPVYSNFGLEVLVDGWSLEHLHARGKTYVEARQGAEYELQIRNPLPVRVAVALSVDGLNTIDARRTTARDASKWVIEPYGTIRIGGWQMSSERARKFYFTSERDSYAARLGRASDLGVITAVFYREDVPAITYRRTRPYHADEDHMKREGERAENAPAPEASAGAKQRAGRDAITTGRSPRDDEYAATGIGRSVNNHVYRVDMKLERNPAAEITIRYEYRPALIQLGVIPRQPPPYTDPLRRRERARGFEDSQFCPEP